MRVENYIEKHKLSHLREYNVCREIKILPGIYNLNSMNSLIG